MKDSGSRGFTLIEAITVIVVLIILLAAAVLLLRPKSYAASDNDSVRRLGLSALAQALQEYKRQRGVYPEGIPKEPTSIANSEGSFDLCPFLVPKHIYDIPLDPELGAAYIGTADKPQTTEQQCNKGGVNYVSGYTIREVNGVITLSAITSQLKPLELTLSD